MKHLDDSKEAGPGVFVTTHWSVVLAAGHAGAPDAAAALENLCRTYWYPLYAFLRRQGKPAEEAEDLTQDFFARFLERGSVSLADPARGRFRSFLLASMANFSAERRRYENRQKRGGGRIVSWDGLAAEQRYLAEPRTEITAEVLYERRWALTVIERGLARLEEELAAKGKAALMIELKRYLWGEPEAASYALVSARLGMTEGALKVTMHRLRLRFGELLREEVSHTVSEPGQIEDELRRLLEAVRA